MSRCRLALFACSLAMLLASSAIAGGTLRLDSKYLYCDGSVVTSGMVPVGGDVCLYLSFNRLVDAGEASRFIVMKSSGRTFDLKVSKGDELAKRLFGKSASFCLVVKPVAKLEPGKYSIELLPQLPDESGARTLAARSTIRFEVVDRLVLESVKAKTNGVDDSDVFFRFNQPVPCRELRKHVTVRPYTYFWTYGMDAPRGGGAFARKIRLSGGFKPGETYTFTVSDKLKSKVGCTMSTGRVLKVEMPPVSPTVSFIEENRVIELKSRQLLHVALVNVGEVVCELIRIPAELVRTACYSKSLGGPHRKSRTSKIVFKGGVENHPYKNGETDRLYRNLQSRLEKVSSLTFPSPPSPPKDSLHLDAERFFCLVDKVRSKAFSIPLAFREDKEAGGTFIACVSGVVPGRDKPVSTGYRMIQITDIAVSFKRSEKQLLFWVTSLSSGKPLPGAAVYVETKDFRFELGKTGDDGVLLADLSKPYKVVTVDPGGDEAEMTLPGLADAVAVVKSGNDYSWIKLDGDPIEIPSGIDVSDSDGGTDLKGYAFTERGIYKPGDEVEFKLVSRRFAEGRISTPAGRRIYLRVKGPRGEELHSRTLELSDFGTAHGTVPMKTFNPLGTYRLLFYSDDKYKKLMASASYELQEFRPPRHKVRIAFDTSRATEDGFVGRTVERDYVTATIKGLYYAGGPVRHGKVNWSLDYVSTDFKVESEPDFEFKNHLLRPSVYIETGEAMLDESGEVKVRIPIAPEVLSGAMGLEIEATVQDFDGRPATGTERFCRRPAVLVGTSKHPEEIEMGESTVLKAIVLEDGKRVQEGEITVEVMRQTYMSIRKVDATGRVRWEGEDVYTRSFKAPLRIENGVASFDFDFNSGGSYLVRFIYKAADGHTYTASSKYRVSGYWYDSDERVKRERRLSLMPDKSRYAVGDKARLAVRGRRKAVSYLLTIEREKVFEYRLVDLSDGKGFVDIPIKAAYAPDVYVSVIAPTERSRFPIYATEADVFKPVCLFGVARLDVKPASKMLDVSIDPDTAARDPRPGERMSLTVSVKDGDGKPVDAEVALCVVDEGVLALTAFKTPDLSRLFVETLLGLDVETQDLRNMLLGQSPFREFSNKPFTGGGGAFEKVESKIERKNFDPLAFWAPALCTGSDGKAMVSFKLPDTITSYRIYAVVVDRGDRFGSAEKQQKVVKPFYVEPGLPRFMVRGDSLTVPVLLFNKTGASGRISLDVRPSSDVVTVGDFALPSTIGPYAGISVPVSIKARRTGKVDLLFEGRMNDLSDRVRSSISVSSRLAFSERVDTGRMKRRAMIKAELPPDMDDVPDDERQGTRATLTITDNPLLEVAPGLRYLLHYPYGCIEQTSSGVMSLSGLRALVKAGKVPGIEPSEADKYLGPGIERILSMQLASGGFSYWPGGGGVHDWGTVFAVNALLCAKEAGADVPGRRLDKALAYLKKQCDGLLKKKVFDSIDGMALYDLARSGLCDKVLMKKLSRRIDAFSREGRLFFLLALEEGGGLPGFSVYDEFTGLYSEHLESSAQVDFDYRLFSSTERMLSLMALLARKIDLDDSIGDELVGRILARARHSGRWSSTHDTGWCLFALASYLESSRFLDEAVTLTLRHGGDVRKLELEPGRPVSVEIDGRSLVADPSFVIEGGGAAELFYELRYRVPLTEAARRRLKKGYSVSRKYKLPGGLKRGIRVGDIVEVELNVELPGDGDYLVLEDPLPAGLVAINSKLATEPSLSNREDERLNYSWWEGFLAFVPQYVEFRDDRVRAFRNRAWSRHYRYVYYARAVVPGTFTAPSASIREMYRPDRAGFSPSEKLVIKPRGR